MVPVREAHLQKHRVRPTLSFCLDWQDMERFKVCEKETKTKAFSKEGLAQAAKKDPEELARDAACEWLESCVEQIEQQKETVEAEIEQLNSGKKKKNTDGREDELLEIMERHTFHTTTQKTTLPTTHSPSPTEHTQPHLHHHTTSHSNTPQHAHPQLTQHTHRHT